MFPQHQRLFQFAVTTVVRRTLHGFEFVALKLILLTNSYAHELVVFQFAHELGCIQNDVLITRSRAAPVLADPSATIGVLLHL